MEGNVEVLGLGSWWNVMLLRESATFRHRRSRFQVALTCGNTVLVGMRSTLSHSKWCEF